ncbi:helix-turn-helix transcriptional regulator [Nocardia gipuzkoensis]
MGIRQRRRETTSQALAGELARQEIELKRALIRSREAAGLSQSQLADKIGVHRSVISRFERADSNPRLSMLRYYAHALGVLITHKVEPFRVDSPVDMSFAPPGIYVSISSNRASAVGTAVATARLAETAVSRLVNTSLMSGV